MKEKVVKMEEIESIYSLSYIKYPLYILVGTLLLISTFYSVSLSIHNSKIKEEIIGVTMPNNQQYLTKEKQASKFESVAQFNRIANLYSNPLLERFSDIMLIYIGITISFLYSRKDEK